MHEKVTVQKYPQGQPGFILPCPWYIGALQVIAQVRGMLMQQHKPLWSVTTCLPLDNLYYREATKRQYNWNG